MTLSGDPVAGLPRWVRPIAAADRWLLTPAPAERLAVLRVLIGGFALGYLVVRMPQLTTVAGFDEQRWDPVGVLLPLSKPMPEWLGRALPVAALAAAVPFVLGWRHRVVGPAFAFLLLVVTTHRSSWGQVFVTEDLMVLHVAIVGLSPAALAYSLDRRRSRRPVPEPSARFGWPVRLLCITVVLTYFAFGWAKLADAGLPWVTGDALRNHVAHHNLQFLATGDLHSPLGGALIRYAWLFSVFAAYTVAMELLAPVALFGRRTAHIWVATAWVFSVGVLVIMVVFFAYPLFGVAFAPFFAVEQLPVRLRRRLRRTVDEAPAAQRGPPM